MTYLIEKSNIQNIIIHQDRLKPYKIKDKYEFRKERKKIYLEKSKIL